MPNDNAQSELKASLESLKQFVWEKDGNMICLTTIPKNALQSKEDDTQEDVHLVYSGFPEIWAHMLVAGAKLDPEFSKAIHRAMELLNDNPYEQT